jgi:hypothetical protein
MANTQRVMFLNSALERAERRLKLCTGQADWRGARAAAEDAAAIDDELKALRAAAEQGPQNVVGRVRAQG